MNAHRLITVGALVARPLTISPIKFSNPNKTMKKISSVPFSNPIPTNELFIHQTFIRKAKAKGLSEQEAESKFQAFLKSGEIWEWEEQTENLFERTVKIYFSKKC
jgi:hypothetical protein